MWKICCAAWVHYWSQHCRVRLYQKRCVTLKSQLFELWCDSTGKSCQPLHSKEEFSIILKCLWSPYNYNQICSVFVFVEVDVYRRQMEGLPIENMRSKKTDRPRENDGTDTVKTNGPHNQATWLLICDFPLTRTFQSDYYTSDN